MKVKVIDASTLIQMIRLGATNLGKYKDIINQLNVFPVPDGDTGTNMNLSMASGLKELNKVTDENLTTVGTAFIRGLLMGARGNSGVILSQIFRGFSKEIEGKTEINQQDLARALENGVTMAYQSVTNPVEGTILTVAKDAANFALQEVDKSDDMVVFMEKIVKEAAASLERTPDLLPILKEVGVVDSGGKGLLVIYEGFLAALKGEELPDDLGEENMAAMIDLEHNHAVQSFIDIESIEFGYCTEFIIEFSEEKLAKNPFDKEAVRDELSKCGDSLLIAVDEEFFKVHIHAEYPGEAMTIAQRYGELTNIDIENMRKQYTEIIENTEPLPHKEQVVGVITVAAGKGIVDMFKSVGASVVIEGGQTMNPSTEDFLLAIEQTNAKTTYILPNNSNIILAANQAKEISDKEIIVIPSKSVPQGIAALFAYDEEADNNEAAMIEAISEVKTGHVTYAIRDTEINDMTIKKDDFMGIDDTSIKVTAADKIATAKLLLEDMIDCDETEILTVFYGDDVQEVELNGFKTYVTEKYADLEIEFHAGNQPVYSFIFMIE